MDESAPERYALFPLTVFDNLFERTTFVTGWLVEGTIDSDALSAALDRVSRKWRMLSGRLQSVKEQEKVQWQLRIPIGKIPPEYPTFALTTTTSSLPLSHYVPIPIPSTSNSFPPSVFLHSSTPRQYTGWESTNHPLTCWNLTYFPASANNGVAYTCIGFSRCHGIFDGGGAASVMNALVAEMNGNEWVVPPLPHEGMNANLVEEVLAHETRMEQSCSKNYQDYSGYTFLGVGGYMKLIAWHVRERWWRGAERRIILMPKVVMNHLVEEVRASLRSEQRQTDHVTTGDILVAWIFKTVYSTATKPSMMVHCTNLASFRALLGEENEKALNFPHNAFIPLPYPVLSIADLKSFSLHALTNLLAASRASLSMHHVVTAYKCLQQSCFPNPPGADETIMVSNVSASRILESDWTAVGSRRTLCGYRYQATPTDVLFTNAVYIAGRLDDGSVVLDVTLNKARFELLSGEVQRITARLARNQNYDTKRS
ncbi:hypothetical protein M413DRAFT_10275 [Hebeloma cylindrosporum]|uniref:Uncharacterized protein n=1 Tax=Hebeloma cylindrosporum TaxID=76867 RepID=A0A0C3CF62_HEBCY|nr:hypothetical protein M413DRAFT_10275 [Hebeloma cylindrosporum h7]